MNTAPWPDFAGKKIREGDTIEHPADHTRGTVVSLPSESDPADQWWVNYGKAPFSRLCLQIGEKGRAIVVDGEVLRGTGQTTRQMAGAPRGAIFVWCDACLDYPRRLARDLGRVDLVIISPALVESRRWRGCELTGIVVDHYTRLTEEQVQELIRMEAMVR